MFVKHLIEGKTATVLLTDADAQLTLSEMGEN